MTKSSFVFPTSNEGVVTATAASAAVTCNAAIGLITTETLASGTAIAAGWEYTLTLANNRLKVGSMVHVTCSRWTATTWVLVAGWAVCSTAGTATIYATNVHASDATNGTFKIGFFVVDQR